MSYLEVHYNSTVRPITSYPFKLTGFLQQQFSLASGMLILDYGCGRGEISQAFRTRGFRVVAADTAHDAGQCLEDNDFVLLDGTERRLPFADGTFDVVFSKSVIEHLSEPLATMSELVRVLKPGGQLISLTPDWEQNFKIFFDDVTHVRPYSRKSMSQLYRLLGLEEIRTFRFRQLPICWRFSAFNILAACISPFVPVRTQIKFLRWSRELMLAGTGKKPKTMETAGHHTP